LIAQTPPGAASPPSAAALEAADRHVEAQRDAFLTEHQALIEAVYDIAADDDDLNPTVARIVEQSGLSNQAFYSHFTSKDELLLAVLEDGRHRLVEYLDRRMGTAASEVDAVEEWIRGVMAQAADDRSARRSRPFALQADRLAADHSAENRRSVELLKDQFSSTAHRATSSPITDATVDFEFWSCLAEMQRLLRGGVTPTADEIDSIVGFVIRGLGLAR
jgi:AcrR family transcriptional regulator